MLNKILTLLISASAVSYASGLVRENFQSVRGAGMGNASIAFADDSNCLWINPAGLAFIKGGHFNLFDITFGFDSLDTANNFKNLLLSGDSANLISEGQTFVRGSIRPTYIGPYFGFSIYDQANGFWNISDLSLPEVDIYANNDVGIISGLALPFSKYFAIGVTGRFFQRSGVDTYMTTADFLASLNLSSTDFMAAMYESIAQRAGIGYAIGINLGAQAKIPLNTKGGPILNLAGTIEDIGNTVFRPLGTTAVPTTINASYHAGFGVDYEIGKLTHFRVSGEMRHLFADYNIVKKLHFGLELKHKFFSLRTGLHQGYLTYGASFELLPHTKVHFASYASETGQNAFQSSTRWYLLQTIIGFSPY